MARPRNPKSPRARFFVPSLALLAVLAAPAGAAVKKMFVTSVTGSANLSTWLEAQGQTGLAAGDAICQTLAHDGAGLPTWQDFRAWLSTSTEDAYCRVAGFDGQKSADCGELSLPDAGPWERLDGEPFATSLSQLTANSALLHAPIVDETGALAASGLAFTGTLGSGAAYAAGDCSGWTLGTGGGGRMGLNSAGGFWWTSASTGACSLPGRLFCFETGVGDALPAWEGPGNLVFASSIYDTGDLGSWPEADGAVGLAAGDAICESLATSAGLPAPDSFVAWLSTSTVDAVDRVISDGPFKRVDGVEVAASRADLLTATSVNLALESAISVDETGDYVASNAFTGTNSAGLGTLHDCSGWTSSSFAVDATFGRVQETRGAWTGASDFQACGLILRIYCISNLGGIFRDGFESGDRARWSASLP